MSLGVILLLLLLFRPAVFDFTIGLWATLTLILGHPGSVRSGFHLTERDLTSDQTWLVTLTSFVPPLSWRSLQAGRGVDRSICAGLVFTFLLWEPAENLPMS